MRFVPGVLSHCVLLACVCLLAGCGAGLIAGIASTQGNPGTGEVAPPELSLTPLMPLVPAPNTSRSVVVANVQIATTALIRVRIDAGGVGVDQQNPVASGQGGSTLITFTLATAPIVASIADPSAADVEALLSVLVDDHLVAAAVPIVLARQPRATLVIEGGASEQFVSPLGERVRLRVDGLRSEVASDVQLLVTTPDPAAFAGVGAPIPMLTRLSTDVRFETASGAAPEISALVPGNTFPVQVQLVVSDAIAGLSTTVTNAYYRPDIALALPSQGPTTGGTLLTLIGTALVPFDFTAASGPAQLAFEGVELSLAKGAGNGLRITSLPREDFRTAESDGDRLVFTMPPSPDGRPGQVDIVLRVRLQGVTATVVASRVFLFANPDPFFGPRGIVLDRLPVAVAPIALDQAPSSDLAPDFAALTDQGGVAFLQLLLAQQNGMFQAFAAPRQIGNPEVIAEREPRDLCIGDFDGDLIPDVFIANAGGSTATHHLVLGQAAPLPPLGAVHPFSTAGGMYRCRAAFFDGDGLPDVLLVPGPTAAVGQMPLVLLARPMGPGLPQFAAPIALDIRSFPYEAFEIADLDGDGKLDVALVSGTQGKLDVAYGNGDGTFQPGVALTFTVPGYAMHPDSPAVGLHACADGAQQSLGLVLSGLLSSFGGGPTQPMVTMLRQQPTPPDRVYLPPALVDTFTVPTEPIGQSLVADLDQQQPPRVEMVLAIRDEPQFVSFGLLQLSETGGFLPILGGIEGGIVTGTESPRQIRALVFDRAFPVSPAGEPKAVFVVHETEVDGARERRLSTRLVLTSPSGPPRLLPPDAGAQVAFRIESVIAGNFHSGTAAVRDLALVRTTASAPTDAIVLVANDGFGGFPQFGNRVDFTGLLPDSVTLLPSANEQIDALAFCASDSRVAVWRHDPAGLSVQAPDAVSTPLRDLVADPVLSDTNLADTTRIRRGDVDGDGIDDLVVLLSFAIPSPAEGQAALVLMRGKSSPAPGEFPFHVPTGVTPVHGLSSAIELGDFTRSAAGPVHLELAVAVPEGPNGIDGDHVRFFRYQAGATPADDLLVPAAASSGPQVLLAGSEPTQLAAADFDRDGSIDLLVACRGDSTVRLFRNSAPVTTSPAVVVGAFTEALNSPWQLAAGEPTMLRLSDVNGDGNLDAVAFTEAHVSGQASTTVAIYLSSGAAAFDGPRNVSPTRIGNRNARLSGDLGDWNRDGLPDLCLGWNTSVTGDINLRVLFGGTR